MNSDGANVSRAPRQVQYFEHPPRSHLYAAQVEALNLAFGGDTTSPNVASREPSLVEPREGDSTYGSQTTNDHSTTKVHTEDVRGTLDLSDAALLPSGSGKQALNSLMLLALMYTFTISGAYGIEESVQGGGPLLTILVTILIPVVMGIPTALVVAELATAMPSNAGFLMWINVSVHPIVYFAIVLLSLIFTFVDNALYPVLFSEYLCTMITCTPTTTKLLRAGMVLVTYILNVCGVEAVGNVSIVLTILTVLPFVLMFVIHLLTTDMYLNWQNIAFVPSHIDWTQFIATASWNLSGIEQAGSVAEEIKNPQSSIIKALIPLMGLAFITYIPPILTGASTSHRKIDLSQWVTGYWSTVSLNVAGVALKTVTVAGSIISAFGLTLSATCTTSFTIAGMATTEAFPWRFSEWLSARNKRFGSYHWAITFNAVATGLFSTLLDFGPLVKIDQFLYGIRVVTMFFAFFYCRAKYPSLARPFCIPLAGYSLAAAFIIPTLSFISLTVVAMIQDKETVVLCCSTVAACFVISVLYCVTLRRNGFKGRVVTLDIQEKS